MKKLTFIASLADQDNDYSRELAAAAEAMALCLGVEVRITFASSDSGKQSQQILDSIHGNAPRPDGILVQPAAGGALPHAARAAVAAGTAWVVLDREANYLAELRRSSRAPAFSVASDHEEIGRIHGRQFAVFLPNGGFVLYVTGPGGSLTAKQRTAGVHETRPASVQAKIMKADWTEASAHRTVSSWLRLSTTQRTQIDMVAAQNDAMAMGAKRAFEELPEGAARDRWLSLPFLGCDGLPHAGQVLVRRGALAATVVVPPNTGHALELLVKALRHAVVPSERNVTIPESYPPIDELRAKARGANERQTLSAGA